MRENQSYFSIGRMCQMLLLERSGYYAWLCRPISKRALSNAELDKKILVLFKTHQGRYGSKRLTEELRATGEK